MPFCAYYSTAVEDSVLVGKPCFVLQNSNQICIKNNIIDNDLFKIINIDLKFNIDDFLSIFIKENLKKYHQLLLKSLFSGVNRISFENALNEK